MGIDAVRKAAYHQRWGAFASWCVSPPAVGCRSVSTYSTCAPSLSLNVFVMSTMFPTSSGDNEAPIGGTRIGAAKIPAATLPSRKV
jgi:hypothetical protein